MSGLAWLLALCAAIQAVALMAWFGALSLERVIAAATIVRTGAARTELLPRLLRQAGPIAILAGALCPWLQVGVVLDDPRALLDADQISQVLTQTSFGRIALAREVLVIVAVVAAGLPAGFAPAANRATYVLLAAALGSVALIGHAAGIGGALGGIERTTLALHLLAAGAWLGALPVLWVLADRQGSAEMAQTLERFSRFGAVLVVLVLASGTLSAWYRLGGAQLLFTSGYGRILLGKIALVGAMGAIALFNRKRLTPALKRPDLQEQLRARRALRWSIALETAVGTLVVAVAFVLGSAEAPQ